MNAQGCLPGPVLPDETRVTKTVQRGFRVDLEAVEITPKMSVENFLEPVRGRQTRLRQASLGYEKISRSSRSAAEICRVRRQKSF
jgi:hypothetical protein